MIEINEVIDYIITKENDTTKYKFINSKGDEYNILFSIRSKENISKSILDNNTNEIIDITYPILEENEMKNIVFLISEYINNNDINNIYYIDDGENTKIEFYKKYIKLFNGFSIYTSVGLPNDTNTNDKERISHFLKKTKIIEKVDFIQFENSRLIFKK